MANIQHIANISIAFACLAANGDETGLTRAEVDAFHLATLDTVWHSVGENAGYGTCEITGLGSELVQLIADIPNEENEAE